MENNCEFSKFEVDLYEAFKNEKLNIEEVCQFIESNMDNFVSETVNLKAVIPIIHKAILCNNDRVNVSTFICALIRTYAGKELYLHVVLQIGYQILKTQLSQKPDNNIEQFKTVFNTLLDLVKDEDLVINRESMTNGYILICLKLCLNQVPEEAEKLKEIWLKYASNKNCAVEFIKSQLTVILYNELSLCFSDFENNEHLLGILQNLLKSEQYNNRKTALYLLRKKSDVNNEFWTIYINIFKILEESQSHLIVPILEKLKNLNLSKHEINKRKFWLEILFSKLLQQENVIVVRWIIIYLLEYYEVAQLNDEVLISLVNATNSGTFFNPESFCISQDKLSTFILTTKISANEWKRLLEILVKIEWKSLPLYYWLNAMPICRSDESTSDLMLQLASCVRCLQNKQIRVKTVIDFERIFFKQIQIMTLKEYILLIETLYNVVDNYVEPKNIKLFTEKLILWSDNGFIEDVNFSERLYNIFISQVDFHKTLETYLEIWITKCFNKLSRDKHGWFRFLFVFDLYPKCSNQILINYFLEKYGFDIKSLKDDLYDEVENKLLKSMSDEKNEDVEKSYVSERSNDFFLTTCVNNFDELLQKNYKFLDVINHRILKCLCDFYLDTNCSKDFLNLTDLNTFVCELDNCKHNETFGQIIQSVLNCCVKKNDDFARKHAEELLKSRDYNVYFGVINSNIKLSIDILVDGLLYENVATEEERIEDIFTKSQFNLRETYYEKILKHNDEKMNTEIMKTLLKQQKTFYAENPNYIENSKEHRQQILIAHYISKIFSMRTVECTTKEELLEFILNILLNQTNQLNVTCIYENLASRCIQNFEKLFSLTEKISNYSVKGQISILTILNSSWQRNGYPREQKEKLCNMLMPLILNSDSDVCFYVQLVVYNMVENEYPQHRIDYMMQLKTAIEKKFGNKDIINYHRKGNVRLLPTYYTSSLSDIILYITDAPSNLFGNLSDYSKYENKDRRLYFKEEYSKKHREESKGHLNKDIIINNDNNVQQKMHPNREIIGEEIHSLISYPEDFKNNEIYVVASLINKLPNLGGIARTCEVLGIKNLVLSSKMLTKQNEFQNLSMTAEKSLNIIEVKAENLIDFLMQKRAENFKIVGAEQNAKTENFKTFEFPKKCILLLGHENDGIPADICGLLDYSIVISKAVGTLFTWEYIKLFFNK